jgi:hypothetical protein
MAAVMVKASPHENVEGVLVADFLADEAASQRIEKVTNALRAVERVTAWRYRQLQRYLTRIFIVRGGEGFYDHDRRALLLDSRFVDTQATNGQCAEAGRPV